MTSLDGNAVAGLLQAAFGADMTAALGTCAACGFGNRLAQLDVYQGAGTTLRCPRCQAQLMVIVDTVDVLVVDAMGLAALDRTGPDTVQQSGT